MLIKNIDIYKSKKQNDMSLLTVQNLLVDGGVKMNKRYLLFKFQIYHISYIRNQVLYHGMYPNPSRGWSGPSPTS